VVFQPVVFCLVSVFPVLRQPSWTCSHTALLSSGRAGDSPQPHDGSSIHSRTPVRLSSISPGLFGHVTLTMSYFQSPGSVSAHQPRSRLLDCISDLPRGSGVLIRFGGGFPSESNVSHSAFPWTQKIYPGRRPDWVSCCCQLQASAVFLYGFRLSDGLGISTPVTSLLRGHAYGPEANVTIRGGRGLSRSVRGPYTRQS
jgi:hypothetical protein